MSALWRVVVLVARLDRLAIVALVGAALVGAAGGAIEVTLVGSIMSSIEDGGTPPIWMLLAFVTAIAVVDLAAYGSELYLGLTGERVARYAAGEFSTFALSRPVVDYEDHRLYDQMVEVTSGLQHQPIGALSSLARIVASVGFAAGGLLALWAVEPILAVGTAVAATGPILAAVKTGRLDHELFAATIEPERERAYVLGVIGARTSQVELRLFGFGSLLRKRYDKAFLEVFRIRGRIARTQLAVIGLAEVFSALLILVLLSRVVSGIGSPAERVVTMSVLFVALQRVVGSLGAAGGGVGNLVENLLYLSRAFELVSTDESTAESGKEGGSRDPYRRLGTVVLQLASFRYPNSAAAAVRTVTLSANAGERIAIVGRNGSGKTTLGKLLLGVFEPTDGSSWAEVSGRQVPISQCLSSIAEQDFTRLEEPIEAFVRPPARRMRPEAGEIEQVLKIEDVVAKLPDGYDTQLGRLFEGGIEISSGEWQRLVVARALACEAAVVVLDEPTAYLDEQATDELVAALELCGDAIVFTITHDPDVAAAHDRVLVMDNGRLIEQGRPETLLREAQSAFRQVFERIDRPRPDREEARG